MVDAIDKTAYKPLNAPERIMVKEDATGLPAKIGKGNLPVMSIEDRWRIDDEWWRTEPISRMYYAVVLNNGQHMIIYKDIINGFWYRQTIGTKHMG